MPNDKIDIAEFDVVIDAVNKVKVNIVNPLETMGKKFSSDKTGFFADPTKLQGLERSSGAIHELLHNIAVAVKDVGIILETIKSDVAEVHANVEESETKDNKSLVAPAA